MAQRYGGKFSPEDAPKNTGASSNDSLPKRPFDGARRTRAGGRVNLLFVAPLPLLIAAFTSDPIGLGGTLASFGALILAAWLTREGILAQEAYEARKIARRPALPRKMLAALITGGALFFAGSFQGQSLVSSAIFGVLGAVLHSFSFGFDPLKDKGMEGIDTFQQDRVARAVEEAEKHIEAMKDAIKRATDRKLEARVERFASTARDMFRTVEEDPRDLTAARKYLGVYLMGARDATVAFADLFARNRSASAREDYLALLDDLEANFAAKTTAFLSDNRDDLDIEISVLRDRLAREGIRSENSEI
ncbi:MAG: 5-bromo-4-chloroindolyl phosphate hydrolysis family protein [Paracoccaceae bacterium]